MRVWLRISVGYSHVRVEKTGMASEMTFLVVDTLLPSGLLMRARFYRPFARIASPSRSIGLAYELLIHRASGDASAGCFGSRRRRQKQVISGTEEDLMADFSGSLVGKDERAGEPLDVYSVPNLGWFARNWGDRRGPYLSRELAENEFTRMCTTDPGLTENWLEVARLVGSGLLCSSIILAGALLLALAMCVLGWSIRPF
jgi:hypothetical protein